MRRLITLIMLRLRTNMAGLTSDSNLNCIAPDSLCQDISRIHEFMLECNGAVVGLGYQARVFGHHTTLIMG